MGRRRKSAGPSDLAGGLELAARRLDDLVLAQSMARRVGMP